MSLLNCGKNMLNEGLIYSCHLAKETHFLGVKNLHVLVHVRSCAIWYDEWNRVVWVNKGRV